MSDRLFTAEDFADTRGRIVFATGPNSKLTNRPTAAHIAAWNKRVHLPPSVVANYFADSFAQIDSLDCKTEPRIIFSVKNEKSDPSILFEIWRKGADLPTHWNGKNRSDRVFRANRLLRTSNVYGMWCGVTSDFNLAGKKTSLRQHGIGKKIQAVLMPIFMAMGYKRFDLHASSEGGHKGAYIWPRFGVEVEKKTTGMIAGYDTLPRVLRKKFNELAKTNDIPAGVARRINKVLDRPDATILKRLTDIRCEIDDPDHAGKKAQLTEIMLREQYIKCHFDFESAAWRKHFFDYVGADLRPALQQRLDQWQKKSPS